MARRHGSEPEMAHKVGDRVMSTWLDGTSHVAEIIDSRKKAPPGGTEYYVHYIERESLDEGAL
jgi:hypothetical protein